jgi:hypothetical protein
MAVDIAKIAALLKGCESKLGAPLTDAEKSAMKKQVDALVSGMEHKALPAIQKAVEARKKWLKLWDVVNNEINAAGGVLKGVSANQKAVADLADKLAKSCRAKKADAAAQNLDLINYYATNVDLVKELLERAHPEIT